MLDGELVIGSARPVRCRVDGRGREKRGWYMLHEMPLADGGTLIVGSYGVWQGNDHGAVRVTLPKADKGGRASGRLSAQQLEAHKARMLADRRAAAAELAREHERASARATAAWGKCRRDGAVNDYLVAKGLPPGKLYGARVSPSGSLVVPIADGRGRIWGLQAIRKPLPAGSKPPRRDRLAKEYWPAGLRKQGNWHLIGILGAGGVVLVCEGFATGASLHEATGLPVAVAFDAGNLLPVCVALAAQYKRARILVCADDDWLQRCQHCDAITPVEQGAECVHCGQPHGKANAGVAAAQAAALAVGGEWARPQFPSQRPADTKGATDYNDLHQAPDGGLALVGRQIEAVLQAKGWRAAVRAATPSPEGGGGERPRALSVMPLDDLVERYVPIDDGTGDALYDRWARRIVARGQAVALLSAGVRWDDVKRHPVWIDRGAYYLDEVGFDPGGTDPAVKLNTWQGWPKRPDAEGKCDRLLHLLRYLCTEDDNGDEVFWWLVRWMAYPLQNPGAKLPSAVIMHGPQGTGKSTIFQALASIYGNYATVLNQRGLEDKFNADWVDSKLFLLAEEVVTRQEMWHIKNELKELVTGEWVRVNGKHVGAFRQRNHINIVFLSNEGQPLPLDNDDRRHLVVWTPPQREAAYYDAVHDEIAAGGIEALYHHLLHVPMDGWQPHRRPPMTQAKRDLIQVSRSSELRFLQEWLDRDLGLPVCPALSVDLYQAYVRWCDRSGERRSMRSREQFLNAVAHQEGWEKRKARLAGASGGEARAVVIPPASVLERSGNAQPPDQATPSWLAATTAKFSAALRAQSDPVGTGGTAWAA